MSNNIKGNLSLYQIYNSIELWKIEFQQLGFKTEELEWETWTDKSLYEKSRIHWKTLFSRDVTRQTESITQGICKVFLFSPRASTYHSVFV